VVVRVSVHVPVSVCTYVFECLCVHMYVRVCVCLRVTELVSMYLCNDAKYSVNQTTVFKTNHRTDHRPVALQDKHSS